MAITAAQLGTGLAASGTATIAKAYTSNVQAGSLLVCAITVYDSTKTPTVSDNLNGAWTQAVSYSNTAVLNHITRIFYFPNSAAGACTVTGSWTGAASSEIHQGEYSGAATVSPLDQTGTGGASSGANQTSAMLPTVNGELVWGWCGFLGSGSLGTGYTQVSNANSNLSEFLVQASAASIQATWGGSGGFVAVAATFQPAGSASVVTPRLMLLGCGA